MSGLANLQLQDPKPLIAQMKNICENHWLTVREVAEEVGIFTGSCHTIITEDLGMHWVSEKFVSRLLTDDLLQGANDNEKLLRNIITSDETWVYSHDAETKQQSSHW
jgi:hypothetical protein